MGSNAGRLITGAGCVAVGRNALLNNTSGGNNIAVGHEAGNWTATGGENTFVGTVGTNTGNKVKGRYIVFANNFSASYNSVESKGYREGSTSGTYFSGTMTGIYFYRMRAGPQSSHIAHPNPSTIPYGATT